MRLAASLLAVLAVGCAEERTPTCAEAVSHTAAIMKDSTTASKREFWTNERIVAGQIRFCDREPPNVALRRCVVGVRDEAGIERCLTTYGKR